MEEKITISGEVRPYNKEIDGLDGFHIIFIPVDNQGYSRAIAFQPEVIEDFKKPTPDPNGNYSSLLVNAFSKKSCYLKMGSRWVDMTLGDALAEQHFSATYTPGGHN